MQHAKFYKIPSNKAEIRLPQGYQEKRINNAPTEINTRKCIIVVSNNVYFAYNFFCDFIQQKKRYYNPKNFRKKHNCSTLQQAIPTKITSVSSLNANILRIKYYKILSNGSRAKIIIKIMGKTKQQHPVLNYTCLNCIIVISNHIYVVHKFLLNINQQKQNSLSRKFYKSVFTVPPFKRFSLKLDRHQFVVV